MSDEKPAVTICTDGGADPNPGPGGWGVVLIHDRTGRRKEISGGDPQTTNNRMELTAAIKALNALKEPCSVNFYTDSEYVKRGITEWIGKWMAKGFKKVENADLWRALHEATLPHDIEWHWVRGHSGHPCNERADALATQEIRRFYDQAGGEDAKADAEIYIVVSARDNTGMWAASVRYHDREQLITGMLSEATSNQLDIIAAAEALSELPENIHVEIYSMSDYLRNGASMWVKGWKRRNWQTKKGDPVKNQDEWRWLDDEMSRRRVEWPDVKRDDPAIHMAFEDVGRRAQEEFEYQMREHPEYFGLDPDQHLQADQRRQPQDDEAFSAEEDG